jgi:molybdopterin-guanine dinucleotide biosynthesis protein A
MDVSAIVLAGGRSTRFGDDKLAAWIGGETVLDRTVDAVRAVAVDIVIVTGVDGRAALPAGVRVAIDAEPDGGPLVGVVAGLEAAANPTVFIAGGDMPWLVPEVLTALLLALQPGNEAAALEADGRAQQLPLAVHREPALAAARVLTAAGGRRLGALTEVLDTALVPEADWRAYDPEAATLRDIDVPDDLPG